MVVAQRRGKTAPKKKPIPPGPRLTLEDVLKAIQVLPPEDVLEFIEARGIDFSLTPEVRDRLTKAGASEKLLEVIRRSTPSLPSQSKSEPAKKTTPKGATASLIVNCEPAECEIQISGNPHGPTKGGTLEIPNLQPGKIYVDARKEGYEATQVEATLRAGAPERVTIRLNPTAGTKGKFGGELYRSMIEALGGDAGLRETRSMTGAGSAVLVDPKGNRRQWAIKKLRLSLPGSIYWEMEGANVKWSVSRTPGRTKAEGSGKLRGTPEAMEIQNAADFFLRYQPAAVMDHIHAGNMRFTAARPQTASPEGTLLTAQGATESFSILLGPDSRPVKITYDSPSGVDSGIQILYSSYRAAGAGRYPTVMEVKFPDSPQHAMRIELTTFQHNAKLSDKDFPR